MKIIKSVCVFCGSKIGSDPAYEEAAIRLGKIFVEKGISLIYGGGGLGLMGAIASAVIEEGGDVVGVIPSFLKEREGGALAGSQLIVTDTMHERKKNMFERSDAFVILPGGIGTLEETFEIATWKQLQLHTKPIVALSINDYWRGLSAILDDMILGGFAYPKIKELITVVDNPEKIFDILANAIVLEEENFK